MSFAHFGSLGSLRKTPEIVASTSLFAPPAEASVIRFDAEATMFVTTTFGFQPSLFAEA